MNPESLLASAGINIGLAVLVLSLFSVFKKQPFNAPVYLARRLASSSDDPSSASRFGPCFSLRRLLPSASWIRDAFRVSEDEVLRTRGLDALVVLRLFKLGSVTYVSI
ncbi:hypothetical protein QJS10_CPA16g01076 [Acorus calamus]|uniref:CSC1/OSCA1-like N-terminal transmembrane domain-containing protein n=1 Tax=Acorus calamus TaxID=4465 RepID=A0AAV9D2R8_ACOCL|nr:hypothetical protein QJS10_CPA16g01076 [Acorus calamus]